MRLKNLLDIYGNGLLNSYSQIFFSNHKIFAVILALASFVDPFSGFAGVLAVLLTQVLATVFSYPRHFIKDGAYTYNALLVGFTVGVYYTYNGYFFVLLFLATMLNFFLTVWFQSMFAKRGLPFLGIPFLITVWVILLGAGNFSTLVLNYRGIYTISDLFQESWGPLGDLEAWLSSLPIPGIFEMYFKSLGSIMFQYNFVAGFLIAIGLFYFSRIAFFNSLIGFLLGFLFYKYFQGDFSQLVYSYIGFNFILSAISLGGFFIVPSPKALLLLLCAIPIIAILISSLSNVFADVGLPMYSLPFNVVVFLVLIALKLRVTASGLDLVQIQQYSSEQNHYKHYLHKKRFKKDTLFHIFLPVIGEWYISQGHAGEITHKDHWKEAWDFDIRDDRGKTYRDPGTRVEDYYCYGLPVVAPQAGWVIKVLDGIPDNPIGESDLANNWGNTIILKHAEGLYSKCSHIKKGTFKVEEGQYVEKGAILGYCGSSGRSPEPHLHFQLQATPYIGSYTLKYPIAYYLTLEEEGYQFHAFDYPKEGETVLNIGISPTLNAAFNLIPGRILEFEVIHGSNKPYRVKWEVFADYAGRLYLYCHHSKAVAYFVFNGTLFYFTDYYGRQKTMLHYFYFGAQRLLMGYYPNIKMEDQLLVDGFFNWPVKAVQDLVAPFYHFLRVEYESWFSWGDDEHTPRELTISSKADAHIGKLGKPFRTTEFKIRVKDYKISEFFVYDSGKRIQAKCID